jgi:hypothetical protein
LPGTEGTPRGSAPEAAVVMVTPVETIAAHYRLADTMNNMMLINRMMDTLEAAVMMASFASNERGLTSRSGSLFGISYADHYLAAIHSPALTKKIKPVLKRANIASSLSTSETGSTTRSGPPRKSSLTDHIQHQALRAPE